MRSPTPDARWQEVLWAIKSEKEPNDPIARAAYLAHTLKEVNEQYAYACDLAFVTADKDAIVAYFLSGATSAEISTSLGIPEDVLIIFQKLVIDLTVFRNKLELLRYSETYRANTTAEGARLVELGVVQGPLALMHHFRHGHEEIQIDAKVFARTMMQQAFYFSMMSRGNQIRSNVAKESLRWLSATTSLLKDYDRIVGESSDSDEALLEIEKRKMTQTPLELGAELSEILH